MKITYNIELLKDIVDDICNLTNISICITDTKYNHIYDCERGNDSYCYKIQESETGRLKCRHSDIDMYKKCAIEKKAVSRICHAGVIDTAIPILKDGFIAGFIMLGRVRLKKIGISYDELLKLTDNPEKTLQLYKKLTYLSEEQLSSLIHLLSYILFENAIEIDYDEFINYATDYIENNLSNDLSIEKLCKFFNVSKNLLYRKFREFYGLTVNEYITKRRLEYAKHLLLNTKQTMPSIAQSVGFDNYTYFSRIFKKHTGTMPSKYRRQH